MAMTLMVVAYVFATRVLLTRAQEDGNIKEVSAEEASAHLSKKLGRKVRFFLHFASAAI
jgi:hypothetical protein